MKCPAPGIGSKRISAPPRSRPSASDGTTTGLRAASPERMKREIVALLTEAGQARPLLIFLEDLHWADAATRETIAYLEAILADDAVLRGVIRDEMTEIRDEFATPRRTTLEHDDGDLEIEDLIDDVLGERTPPASPPPPEREVAPRRPPAQPVPGTSHRRGRHRGH